MTTSSLLVRARALTGFVNWVSARGANPESLLLSAGINPELLEMPDESLSLQSFAHLLGMVSVRLDAPDFGLQLAAHHDPAVLGAIALIAQNSETVGEAIDGVIRHMPYHSPGLQSQLIRDEQWCVVRIAHNITTCELEKRQLAEHTLRSALSLIQTIAQVPVKDWVIHFDHLPGFAERHYRKAFGCNVLFDQPADGLMFPADILDIHIQTANAELRSSGERFVRSVIRRAPLDLALQIQELLGRQLGAGPCTLPVIARQLDIPVHSLQRRLAEQGIVFEDILDGLRRRRTEELLPLPYISLTRIADCLGYTNQTSLTRSCRRWFGETPRTLRNRYT